MSMRKSIAGRFLLISLLCALTTFPLAAQKRPRRAATAKHTSHASYSSHKKVKPSSRLSTQTPTAWRREISPAVQTGHVHKQDKISHTQVRWISSLLPEKNTHTTKTLLRALPQIWAAQQRYENTTLFSEFIRQYYDQHFGMLSPHLKTLFDQISSFEDEAIEIEVTKRISYLAQNKELIAQAALPEVSTLPEQAFRLRYLADIATLTPGNFNPKHLVLSIERRMSVNPQKDFPLRHVSGRAMFKVGQEFYPVFGYNGPLDHITHLYRFLLNGTHKNKQLTVIYDETTRALAIYNHDKTFWLRLSSHEYSSPERLHLHLNELRPVDFINSYGVESHDQINCNLSIPLSVPENLPSHNVQDFLYQQLIVNPVKFWKGNDHVTIERRPIF